MNTIRTADHEEVEDWIDDHGGEPALDGTDLTISFGDRDLETISWPRFFEIFDRENLALLFDEEKPTEERKPAREKYDFVERMEEDLDGAQRTEMDEGRVQENVKETS